MKDITREEEIRYLQVALALQKIEVDPVTADSIIETLDSLRELGEDFNLREVKRIEDLIEKKYNTRDTWEK